MESSGHLYEILTALTSHDSTAVSFEAAVLLAKFGIVQDNCVERLHKALYELSSATRSLVSLLFFNVEYLLYMACLSGFEVFGQKLWLLH